MDNILYQELSIYSLQNVDGDSTVPATIHTINTET
jgi:hypothetical protein